MPSSEQLELSESLEDYLECIYTLVSESGLARSRDISRKLKVSTSSVTGALKTLATRELVNYEPYGVVTLTGKGSQVASEIAHRHKLLRDFFVEVLQVAEDEADATACHMEHSCGGEVVRGLGLLMEFIKNNTGTDDGQWLRDFSAFRNNRREQ